MRYYPPGVDRVQVDISQHVRAKSEERALRAQLKAARMKGKARAHRERLARLNRASVQTGQRR